MAVVASGVPRLGQNYGAGTPGPVAAAPPDARGGEERRRKRERIVPEVPHVVVDAHKSSSGGKDTRREFIRGRLLGKGGFAYCYQFTQPARGMTVAGKVVAKKSLTRERAKQKLLGEIRVHRALSHHRVVRFETFFEDKANVYIMLEVCPNQSLSELVRRRRRLTEPEAAVLMLQLIEGLRYLHAHRVIHRDLKLGNLFLDEDFGVKIGDFGLAALLDHDAERKRTVCGTPNYIAPEVLDGAGASGGGHSYEVDVWSCGVILYAMLVGRPAFETKDVKATYRRIRSCRYSIPDDVHLTSEAQDLIARMLQVDPASRPTLEQVAHHSFFTGKHVVLPRKLDARILDGPLPLADVITGASYVRDMWSRPVGDLNPHYADRMRPREKRGQVSSSGGDAAQTASSSSTSTTTKPIISSKTGLPIGAASTRRPFAVLSSNTNNQGVSSSSSSGVGTKKTVAAPCNAHGDAMAQDVHIPAPVPTSSHALPKPAASKGLAGLNAGARYTIGGGTVSSTSSTTNPTTTTTTTTTNANTQVRSGIRASGGSESEGVDILETRTTATTTATTSTRKRQTLLRSPATVAAAAAPKRHIATSETRPSPENLDRLPSSSSSPTTKPSSSAAAAAAAVSGGDDVVSSEKAFATATFTPTDSSGKPLHSHGSRIRTDTVKKMHARLSRHLEAAGTDASPSSSSAAAAAAAASASVAEPLPTAITKKYYDIMDAENDDDVDDEELGARGPFQPSSGAARGGDVEEEDVHMMHNHDGAVMMDESDPAGSPSQWVACWVDYTSKYGMGYMLAHGGVGVYFNDATKMTLAPDGDTTEYIARSGTVLPDGSKEPAPVRRFSLLRAPEDLAKKVTLLKHFRVYLLDLYSKKQQKCPFEESARAAAASDPEAFTRVSLPYVKKWVRTRHAVLFRLSDRTVQVNFFDGSSVVINSDAPRMAFVDKRGHRSHHALGAVSRKERPDIAKRLRYTKDVLHMIISGASKAE